LRARVVNSSPKDLLFVKVKSLNSLASIVIWI